jgi:hypothetical protein
LGASVQALKKNTEASLVASKEIGLDVSSENLRSWPSLQTRMQEKFTKVERNNKHCESVEQFKYFGTNSTDQNPIHEEIKSKSKSGKFPVVVYIVFLVFPSVLSFLLVYCCYTCVFAVLCVYCCFYFRCQTAGYKSAFGRSCDRPSRHRFFLVSLSL